MGKEIRVIGDGSLSVWKCHEESLHKGRHGRPKKEIPCDMAFFDKVVRLYAEREISTLAGGILTGIPRATFQNKAKEHMRENGLTMKESGRSRAGRKRVQIDESLIRTRINGECTYRDMSQINGYNEETNRSSVIRYAKERGLHIHNKRGIFSRYMKEPPPDVFFEYCFLVEDGEMEMVEAINKSGIPARDFVLWYSDFIEGVLA